MKTDTDIKRDVEAELEWNPEIDQTDIAVKVNQGVVALSGFVSSYPEKYRAEAAVKHVVGVTGVANDIEVRLPARDAVTDPKLARDVVAALQAALPDAWQDIEPLVREGKVALEGAVEWRYQREIADDAVRGVRGVISVRNSIRIQPSVKVGPIKQDIEEAFRRSAQIDANHVSVDTNDGNVTLRGEVRSWTEREQAEQSAWSAPGVLNVKNELTIRT